MPLQQHPLILSVKTENRGGIAGNSPYLAFRRRTEKMQTRKNRKNDEASYEKMLKLRRDLSRAVTLLEMIKKREKTKREQLHLTIEVVEKRYQARDFSGQLQAEYLAQVAKSTTRPAFAPLYSNQYSHMSQSPSPQHQWSGVGSGAGGLNHYGSVGGGLNKRDMESLNGGLGSGSRKEKRQYKKRKHKHTQREKQRLYSSPGERTGIIRMFAGVSLAHFKVQPSRWCPPRRMTCATYRRRKARTRARTGSSATRVASTTW